MTIYVKDGKRFGIYSETVFNGVKYGVGALERKSVREALGIIDVEEPAPPEEYLTNPEFFTRTESDDAPYVIYTRKSDEQIAEVTLAKAKQERARAVAGIIVTTTSGNSFDGYEDAQNRMARALLGLSDTDTMPWVLADNSIAQVTKAELREALRLSGTAMAELWVKPYV